MNGSLLLCCSRHRDAVNLGHDRIYPAYKAERLNRHTCGQTAHISGFSFIISFLHIAINTITLFIRN